MSTAFLRTTESLNDGAPIASELTGSRKHLHPEGSRGAIRAAGAAVFDRQGLLGAAAPRAEGVLPGAAAVSISTYRYDLEIPRHDHVPRCDRETTGTRFAIAHQRRRHSARY